MAKAKHSKVERKTLVPMSDIPKEAREIAVVWVENFKPIGGMEIQQKHKLASDITHYVNSQVASKDEQIKSMTKLLMECHRVLLASPVRFKDLEAKLAQQIEPDLIAGAREKMDRLASATMDYEDFRLIAPTDPIKGNRVLSNIAIAMEELASYYRDHGLDATNVITPWIVIGGKIKYAGWTMERVKHPTIDKLFFKCVRDASDGTDTFFSQSASLAMDEVNRVNKLDSADRPDRS